MPPRGGGISVCDQESAEYVQGILAEKGIKSTITQRADGTYVIDYILSFSQLLDCDFMRDMKNSGKIDMSKVTVDETITARIVDMDMRLALEQAPHVKFSYIENKIRPEKGMESLDEYKVKDMDKMNDFFQKVDTVKRSLVEGDSDDQRVVSKLVYETFEDPIEQWWINQTGALRHTLELQFTNFEEEYELVGINLLYNSSRAIQFLRHKNYDKSSIMFHGCSQGPMVGIFKEGFKMMSASIGKLYGNGHYVTPQAIHAIRYLKFCKDPKSRNADTVTLIAVFVNPGKVKKVDGAEYRNRPITKGFDSHHARVTDGVHYTKMIGHPVKEHKGYPKNCVMDEYAVRDSTRILPRFYITLQRINKVFIWRDKNIVNNFNSSVLKDMQRNTSIYGVTDTKKALELIRSKMSGGNKVYVITNGAHDGQGFVDTVRNELNLDTSILVFCCAVEWHSKWAQLYSDVQVGTGRATITRFIQSH